MPLQIIRQDITKMRVDAIVNTTNEEMIGYAGVDLAVHAGAGPELDVACAALAPLGLGEAKMTAGYNLPARHIIHTSGPVWEGGLRGESIILKSCYIECLKLAVAHGCESVAFPLISSGAYGYPKDQVLKFATQVITEFLYDHELMVYLCVYDRTSYEFSRRLYAELNEIIHEEDFVVDKACCCEDIDERQMPKRLRKAAMPAPCASATMKLPRGYGSARDKTLEEYLRAMDKPFGEKLFDWIDKRDMTDVE